MGISLQIHGFFQFVWVTLFLVPSHFSTHQMVDLHVYVGSFLLIDYWHVWVRLNFPNINSKIMLKVKTENNYFYFFSFSPWFWVPESILVGIQTWYTFIYIWYLVWILNGSLKILILRFSLIMFSLTCNFGGFMTASSFVVSFFPFYSEDGCSHWTFHF